MLARLLVSVLGCAFLLVSPAPAAEDEGPILTEEGLYTESWFIESFLDLRDDLEEARAQGKRFAIMWELKGCPYCRETHFVNLSDPEIREFVKSNFVVLQLNLQGSRAVVDFDGEEMEERKLARKYGLRFSPSFQFFPDTEAEEVGRLAVRKREVARLSGYYRPPHFLAMFGYVHDRAYRVEGFRAYLKRRLKGG